MMQPDHPTLTVVERESEDPLGSAPEAAAEMLEERREIGMPSFYNFEQAEIPGIFRTGHRTSWIEKSAHALMSKLHLGSVSGLTP